MFVGHFAIGLAVKARRPEVPALPLMMAVGFLDILYGFSVVAGIDRITPDLQSGPYLFFDLTFIDWDHSLLMAVFWSLVWAAFFFRNKPLAVIFGLAVFSHFIADWTVHNDDLALYPHAQAHVGLGLWGKLGTISWILEGVFAAVLLAYAWRANAVRNVSSLWPCLLLAGSFVLLSPWLSPMLFVAALGEPAAHLVHGASEALGFLLLAWLLGWLLTRAEQQAGPT